MTEVTVVIVTEVTVVIVTVVIVTVIIFTSISKNNWTPRHQCDVFRTAFCNHAMFFPPVPAINVVVAIYIVCVFSQCQLKPCPVKELKDKVCLFVFKCQQ